ncbi:MAG: GreA/GreB family elongation factor [Clostridia bacterium]|nr:GreA/GreB family elongation factor [Clostridia bacterium]
MYDELTEVDIRKMREEIDYRVTVLRPKLIEDVKTAREWGDLSENFEYKAAKREKNRNDSRVRYLERMIKTAKIISVEQTEGIGLFDEVEILMENLDRVMTVRVSTALRQDAVHGIVSKDSPMGKALLGHRAGDRVEVEVSPDTRYYVTIRKVTKAAGDDESLEIRGY